MKPGLYFIMAVSAVLAATGLAAPSADLNQDGWTNAADLTLLMQQWHAEDRTDAVGFPQSVASGDPTANSLVLWTRAVPLDPATVANLAVTGELSLTAAFTSGVQTFNLLARADHDYCVKTNATGLLPGTQYYYRFSFTDDGETWTSPVGRARTAPSPSADTSVRFAFFSCQFYTGKYYNSYAEVLNRYQDTLDFTVHLGDYSYETAVACASATTRAIVFEDTANAIDLGDRLAAGSLANYRRIYKTMRTDPMFQQVNERWPMLVIWDDREYSDDCWQDTATYFNGRQDEHNADRRRRAEQAFFEYAPINIGLDAVGVAIDNSLLYPHATIYRDFRFGQHLGLALTDYRSFRPDHLIPEDAFPATVVMDASAITVAFGSQLYAQLFAVLDPYVNLDSNATLQASLLPLVTDAYQAAGLDAVSAQSRATAVLQGQVGLTYLNSLLAAAGQPPLDTAGLPRGLSYVKLGKQGLFTSTGSRYMVNGDLYNLYADYRYTITGGSSEDALGATQRTWLQDTLQNMNTTWKVLGSSVSLTPMVLDFTHPSVAALLPPDFPEDCKARFNLNVDQWDGFPDRKSELLGTLGALDNSVIISGDSHGSFATRHPDGVAEFTGAAISADTLQQTIAGTIQHDPALSQLPGMEALMPLLGSLIQTSATGTVTPSRIVGQEIMAHGFVVLEANSEVLTATFHHIPQEHVSTCYYHDPATLHGLFSTQVYEVRNGVLSQTQ